MARNKSRLGDTLVECYRWLSDGTYDNFIGDNNIKLKI
jgi:hypothetical protein